MNIAHHGIRERVGIYLDRAEHYRAKSETQGTLFGDDDAEEDTELSTGPRSLESALREAIAKHETHASRFKVLVRPMEAEEVDYLVVEVGRDSYECEFRDVLEGWLVFSIHRQGVPAELEVLRG